MKRIILVRHAKAEDRDFYKDDLSRDLKKQGKEDARLISLALKGELVKPDLIISSHASRAIQTARIYAETLHYLESQIQIVEDLYNDMDSHDFINLIHKIDESHNTIFIFGHNPTIYYLATDILPSYNHDMPTCTTIGIDFNIETWEDIKLRQGTLGFRLTPHLYK